MKRNNRELMRSIQLLNPDKDKNEATKQFIKKRRLYSIMGFVLVMLIACAAYFLDRNKNDVTVFERETYGGGCQRVTRKYTLNNDKETVAEGIIDIDINSLEYGENQAQQIFDMAGKKLPTLILGENKSLNAVRDDLNLVTDLDFAENTSVYWVSDKEDFVSGSGKINKSAIPDEGVPVTLYYTVHCGSYKYKNTIDVFILPPYYNSAEEWSRELLEKVKDTEENSRTDKIYKLPDEVKGQKVKWDNVENNKYPLILLAVITPVLIYFYFSNKLKEDLRKRREQLLKDYWELTGKIILFMTVGVNPRLAIFEITNNYMEKRKNKKTDFRYVYEELIVFCREISNGVPELEAYDNCASRCELMQYRKLFGYLAQSVKKGSKGTLNKLKEEIREAFEERKALALRLGEEASTKLMLPMFMSLCVVIVILMFPAFISVNI